MVEPITFLKFIKVKLITIISLIEANSYGSKIEIRDDIQELKNELDSYLLEIRKLTNEQ